MFCDEAEQLTNRSPTAFHRAVITTSARLMIAPLDRLLQDTQRTLLLHIPSDIYAQHRPTLPSLCRGRLLLDRAWEPHDGITRPLGSHALHVVDRFEIL
jgi:hypothetical protein